MLQALLLADRFNLAFHREKRDLEVIALVVAEGSAGLENPGPGGTAP